MNGNRITHLNYPWLKIPNPHWRTLRTTLRFVETAEHYGVFVDADDTEYLIGTGGIVLMDYDEIDLLTLWRRFVKDRSYLAATLKDEFQALVESLVVDPDATLEMQFCVDCHEPEPDGDEMRYIANGDLVCDSCSGHYWFCVRCEELYSHTTTTLNDEEVCDDCRANHWSFCEHCDGYYRDDDMDDHGHGSDEDDCGCESPATTFYLPNQGEMLRNDERVTVALPAGRIDEEGFGAVARFLRLHASNRHWEDQLTTTVEAGQVTAYDALQALSFRLSELGDQWQQRDGNFTKRLARFAYKEYGLKLPSEVISHVGNIVRAHAQGAEYDLSVTRHLNGSASDFYHEESCWWTSESEGRCALKSNGGFGLRTWGPDNGYGLYPTGRAWVMPMRYDEEAYYNFAPTFDTTSADAFLVFNGYGALEEYVAPKVLAQMLGMSYCKVAFKASPMWINGDQAFLVGPVDIVERHIDGRVTTGGFAEHADLYDNEMAARAEEMENASV